MKRQIFRCFCGLALAAVFSAQAFAARLLIPVGEVVGLSPGCGHLHWGRDSVPGRS